MASARSTRNIVLAMLVGAAGNLVVAGLPARPVAGAAAPTYAWPEFHQGPGLDGVSTDPAVSTANVGTLGVRWMSPVGATIDSPTVAYNAASAKTLVYEGDKAGYFNAVDEATGQIVWSVNLGSSITSSPLVDGAYVWVAPVSGGKVYKLNGATGATVCTGLAGGSIQGTPVIATPPGGSPTVYFGTLGPVDAFSEADCSTTFAFSSYHQDAGTWDPLSYGVDATGRGLLVFGTADPDSSIYAIDAVTGALRWRQQAYQPAGQDWDIGAGVALSAPGVNGLADGAAYVDSKNGIFYAIDLTTGALMWTYNFGGNGPACRRSSPTPCPRRPWPGRT